MRTKCFEDRKNKYQDAEKDWFSTISLNVQTYDEFPYAKVYCLRKNIFSIHVPCTHNMGDVWLHLVIGDEKAFLIDTGFGVGDLKRLVCRFSGNKEIVVVNTHCHGDHSLGNSQFGKAYIHKFDAPALQYQMRPDYFNEFNHVGEIGVENRYYTDSDIIPFNKYEVVACESGSSFIIGPGHEILLIHMGGHCAGNSVFLDRKNRILFSGDAILPFLNGAKGAKPEYSNKMYYHDACSITTYNKGLRELTNHLEEIDFIFPAHGMLGLGKKLITELYDASSEVLKNPNCFDEELVLFNRTCRVKYTDNSILYYTNTSI